MKAEELDIEPLDHFDGTTSTLMVIIALKSYIEVVL